MIGIYGSSPKVKCREGMCGASQLITELQIPSQNRVSISLRSCVDFVRSEQAEILCRFHRDRVLISSGALNPRSCVDFAEIVCQFRQVIDWGSLEIGSDLKNLHRGGELWERGDRRDGRR